MFLRSGTLNIKSWVSLSCLLLSNAYQSLAAQLLVVENCRLTGSDTGVYKQASNVASATTSFNQDSALNQSHVTVAHVSLE